MWLEAILSKEDFAALAEELFPLTVRLGRDRDSEHYVALSRPTEVSLAPGKGLCLTCKAEVRWPILGVDIPVVVDTLTVLVEPSIATVNGEDRAVFALQVESLDVAWVPAMIDRKIVHAINAALLERAGELDWEFAKTLSHVFALPELLEPLRAVSLGVAWGKVRTTAEAVVFAVSFHTHAVRQGDASIEASRVSRDVAPARGAAEPERALVLAERPRRATVAVSTLVTLFAGYAAMRSLYRLVAHPARARG